MAKAETYVASLANVLSQRPAFLIPGRDGPVLVAYIDMVPGTNNGSVHPVIVVNQCSISREIFAELAEWVDTQFKEE